MTYILSPVLEEETVKEKIQLVNGWIEGNGGAMDQVDEWGLTKFATPIEGKSNGYYVNMYFTAPAETIQVVERNMRINDEFLRYITLKYDAKMMRHRELQKKDEVPSIFTTTTESQE
jgi:small subunit ribosomal protein S6